MGLDCFWKLPGRSAGEGLALPEEGKLCGGLLSGGWAPGPVIDLVDYGETDEHGYPVPTEIRGPDVLVGGSFRGKVYAGLIDEVGGHSLHGDLSPKQVAETATALEKAVEAGQHPRLEELKLLAVVFRAYARAGASLVAWY